MEKALERMKTGKTAGPDDIPVEVWRYFGVDGLDYLTNLFNRIIMTGNKPDEWRKSTLVQRERGQPGLW